MADPTIMVLTHDDGQVWYYVTGTSDVPGAANFAIYKSQDLINWYPHMLAFDEPANARMRLVPGGNANVSTDYVPNNVSSTTLLIPPFANLTATQALTINGRLFRAMWAPHLFEDPTDATKQYIFLSFTAKETFPAKNCSGTMTPYPAVSTLFLVRMPRSSFISASSRFASAAGQPWHYNYNLSGTGYTDGGYTYGQPVPTSVDMYNQFDPCDPTAPVPGPGKLLRLIGPDSLQWVGLSGVAPAGRTILSLDGYTYYDESDSNQRWELYTWYVNRNPDLGFNGNNVAAYPMTFNRTMDQTKTTSNIFLGYRYNQSNLIPRIATDTCAASAPSCGTTYGCLFNGLTSYDAKRLDNTGCSNYGVAEGPAAFYRSGRSYELVSRNGFSSPAYGIFYRHVAGSFAGLGLAYNDSTTAELPLIQSVQRDLAQGRSFGHGEVFKGPTVTGQPQRYFLICHGKKDVNADGADPYRTVYFKELRFAENGNITAITNNAAADPTDSDRFLIPFYCTADFNRDGVVNAADNTAFNTAYFAFDPKADVNGDGVINTTDYFDFSSAYSAGC